MQAIRLKSRGLILGIMAVASVLVLAATDAGAVTLNGGWAPFTRCPVTSPAMEATDGVNTQSWCADSAATGGTLQLGTMGVIQLGPISIGNAPVPAGASDVQFGAAVPLSTFSGIPGIAPSSGAILAAPVLIPGGLLGLICPSHDPIITQLCNAITDNSLNEVTATLESAGAPTDFNLFASLTTGVPIVTLPVKVHLTNALLSSGCYIGSNQHPIVLHPQNTVAGTPSGGLYDLNGAADPNGVLETITVTGSTESDTTFSAPGASGCEVLNIPFTSILLDAVLNVKVGLPSPSGKNSVVLTNASAAVMLPTSSDTPVSGGQFAAGWASAVISQ